jgi:putative IMPACT (imprinted ancient) family translation regulator
LARAYSAATARGVQDAGSFEVIPRVRLFLELPFASMGLRTELEAICASISFQGDFVTAGWKGQVELNEAELPRLNALLEEKSGGRVSWSLVEDA